MKLLKYKYLLIIPLSLFLLTEAIASSLSMQKLAFVNWGNGANQASLTNSFPLHLGPPSIQQAGDYVYILDAAHQRILVVNIYNQQFSTIAYNAPDATDFCITKSGKFSLLFSDTKQVVTYNYQGKPVQTKNLNPEITPLSIYCHQTWVVDTFEGEFYSSDGQKVNLRPFGKYQVAVELINSKKAEVILQNKKLQQSFFVKPQFGKLVTIEVIGIDAAANVFVTTEESKGKQLNRYLKKYTRTGELITNNKLPYSVYAYSLKDLAVSTEGVVYQMLAHKDALKLVKWQTTRSHSKTNSRLLQDLFSYTEDNSKDFEPSEAPNSRGFAISRGLKPLNRSAMMKTAEEYANYSFRVKSKNISSRRQYLGGKKVTTPIRKPGNYTGVPYKWGGFNSLSSFKKGLKNGKKAGDICASKCSGVYQGSSKVVGVDCSGFVSRVWGLNGHQGTGLLPKHSKRIRMHQLRQGDILNRRGRHVMLFAKKDKRGRFHVYEAVGGSKTGKVLKRSHSYSYVKRYEPRRYKNISSRPTNRRKLKRLVVHGNQSIISGKSTKYRAIVLYSNDDRQNVTNKVIWTDTSSHAQFKQAQLKTQSVTQDEEFFIKAKYTENGETVKSGLRITMKASTASQSSISLDFAKVYRSRGSSTIKSFTKTSVLSSSEAYKLIFSTTQTTYVYIYQKDSSGNFDQLFPYGVNGNPTRVGETYFAPNKTEWFHLDNNRGNERIYLITTKKADKALEKQYKRVKTARDSNNYSQLRKTQKKLDKMLNSRVFASRGVGGTVSFNEQGLFSWNEYGQWFNTPRKRLEIKGGIVWNFKHK